MYSTHPVIVGGGTRAVRCFRLAVPPGTSGGAGSPAQPQGTERYTACTMFPTPARRIVHADLPLVKSPSGLPTQHLVSSRDGSRGLFVAQQWLQPGERVLLHTHPVEESLTFLQGEGTATLGADVVAIGPGVTLYVPPGVVHGFACNAGHMHVFFVFSTHEFAETIIVERQPHGSASV